MNSSCVDVQSIYVKLIWSFIVFADQLFPPTSKPSCSCCLSRRQLLLRLNRRHQFAKPPTSTKFNRSKSPSTISLTFMPGSACDVSRVICSYSYLNVSIWHVEWTSSSCTQTSLYQQVLLYCAVWIITANTKPCFHVHTDCVLRQIMWTCPGWCGPFLQHHY